MEQTSGVTWASHRVGATQLIGSLHLCALSLVIIFYSLGSALAQSDKSRTLIIPFPPGGTTDTVGRTVAEKFSEVIGQPVIVVNALGAAGRIAVDQAANATADGHTLLFAPVATVVFNNTSDKPLSPIAPIATTPYVLTATTVFKSISDLRGSSSFSIGNGGVGAFNQVAATTFAKAFGIPVKEIARGSDEALRNDLLAGKIDVAFLPYGYVNEHIEAKKLTALALLSSKRINARPQVRTLSEYGLAGMNFGADSGIFAPPGTPSSVVQQISASIRQVLADPIVVKRIENSAGQEVFPGTSADLAASVDHYAAAQRGDLVVKGLSSPPQTTFRPSPSPMSPTSSQPAPKDIAKTFSPAPPPTAKEASTAQILGRRVALVVGNGAYTHVSRLPNPRKDAEAISTMLRRVGFADVRTLFDANHSQLNAALKSFGDLAEGADWAMVYFAGHGIEMNGSPFLIPIDAKLERDTHVRDEAVALDRVLEKVATARQLRLVVLDACRNNPFAARMTRSAGYTRSVARGLSRVEPDGDVLVAYSAKHGTVAEDGAGLHSPFVSALLEQIPLPGVDVRIMFGRVRDAVRKATSNRQEPYLYGSVGGESHMFVPAAR